MRVGSYLACSPTPGRAKAGFRPNPQVGPRFPPPSTRFLLPFSGVCVLGQYTQVNSPLQLVVDICSYLSELLVLGIKMHPF